MSFEGWKKRVLGAPVMALMVFATACGDDDPAGPGSGEPFDPQQSSQDFAAVAAAFEANADVADDLAYVSSALDTVAVAAWVLDESRLTGASALIQPVGFARAELASVSGQPLLPSDLLGKTFEWDDLEGGYVMTERAGAPANGMRFILYDRTEVPPVENGWLDIRDESDPSADRLAVTLVKESVTRLDYDVTANAATNGAEVTVAGFLTDGVDQVDFDLVESLVETTDGFRIDADYSVSLAGESLGLDLATTVEFGTEISADIRATFVNGADELVIDMSQSGQGAIDGIVEWNGELVMTVSDDGTGNPEFFGPEGEALTLEEAQAIEEMFEIANEGLEYLFAFIVFLGDSIA